jgi:hypothetical protein
MRLEEAAFRACFGDDLWPEFKPLSLNFVMNAL